MRILVLLSLTWAFVLSSVMLGQPLSLGVVGGSSLTEDFQDRSFGPSGQALIYKSAPLRWIVGGMVEVRLPKRFAIEVDGLYHDLAFTRNFEGLPSFPPLHVVTWEIPVLAKYRAPLASVHHLAVIIEAGPSFRTAYNLNGASPSSHGVTAGIGIEVRAWKLRIAPQVRYLRWAHDSAKAFPLTVSDQEQFLVGVSF